MKILIKLIIIFLAINLNYAESSPNDIQSFRFESADIDTVMTQYCEWTFKN